EARAPPTLIATANIVEARPTLQRLRKTATVSMTSRLSEPHDEMQRPLEEPTERPRIEIQSSDADVRSKPCPFQRVIPLTGAPIAVRHRPVLAGVAGPVHCP